MRQLRLKLWVGLALVGGLGSCGGGGQMPASAGDVVIHSDIVPQSFPVDAPISVQMNPSQPINLTMTAGNALTMTVNATGATYLVYTWRYKGWIIEGQSASSYTIPSVQAANEGGYTVTVANPTSVAISQSLNLTVIPKVVPPVTGP
ncbi:MAG: immunoglobulin domain-containing protein [Burkholderiales bacterium]|nr:immunoglobulin domain-containing protein [Burkholderiales bacterium]